MVLSRLVRAGWLLGMGTLLSTTMGCSGCGGSSDAHVVPLTQSEKNLTNIVLAYLDAHGKLDRGPKDVEELKPFLKEFGNPDELLVSPNDNEPYVIIWGVDPSRGGPTDYEGMWQILAYEKKGKGGKRAITDIRGRPMTIPEEDFSKLRFAGRHRPSTD